MGGRGWAGWSGVGGGKWDDFNSIINKYNFKKSKKKKFSVCFQLALIKHNVQQMN